MSGDRDMHALFASIGTFGDINPYIGLGRALISRGHRVTLTVPAFYRRYVEQAGLACQPFQGEGDPTDRAMLERALDPVRGAEFLVRDLLMPRLDEMYEDLAASARQADVIVSHPLTFAAPLVAEMLRRRWVGSVLAPLSLFSRRDPPLLIASPAAAAVHRRWPGLFPPVIAIGRRVTRSWVAPVARMRTRLGLPPGGHPLFEGQFSPYLNLGLFSRVLAQRQRDWPDRLVVTGAVSYDAGPGALSDDLSVFLDEGEPPIVFTLGSSAVGTRGASSFYDVSLKAASTLRRRAVLLVGSQPENRPVSSDQVFVTEWAPHSALFRRAAAVVHQGGAGTLHAALAAGRPMLVVPFAHDQPDNAARADRLGVARVIYPLQYTLARVTAALESLLSSHTMASRATEIAMTVRTEDGAMTAAQALEGLT